MTDMKAVPLGPLHLASHEYFVGPETDGPAVTVRVELYENSTWFTQGVHSITDYQRPPQAGEGYGAWASEVDARDMGQRHVEEQIRERLMVRGAPVVRHALQIEPPLRDQADIQKAAEVLGRQLLASREDPDAPITIVTSLVAAGIPFDCVEVTTEILANHRAQENPSF